MKNHFDVIAIGGGSGGLAVAETAAQAGKRVAIVEPAVLGGACVNVGCVPKKVMWYAAQMADAVKDAASFGIKVAASSFSWQGLIQARQQYVSDISEYWQDYVSDSAITMIDGKARFVDQRTIAVGSQQYTAEHIVIATGSRPIVPSLPGAELGMTSDGFFALAQQPKRIA
ncbi:MAG: FAD-dependent oxidoreductase, partial [Gammaproteobacteria bacterium]|nr:FAD-dependent oxidoreductase [Gammaproteobacteria bacterium]